MTFTTQIEFAKSFQKNKQAGINSIKECFHPDCTNPSINSHILQKNGILSSIENERHLMALDVNQFDNPPISFKRIGINRAYSFNCFCNEHDTELFKEIEKESIDFGSYRNQLLFTLRAIYNERFRKMVNIFTYDGLIKDLKGNIDVEQIELMKKGENMGIADMDKTIDTIWADLNNETQSFVFSIRKISKIDLCLSSFYNYETSKELLDYRDKYGKDLEVVSDVFVNIFPYQDNTVFMMGYKKINEEKVKSYVRPFFTENEKRLLRRITNLLLFQCETWVTSIDFYNSRIKKCESLFFDAVSYSVGNMNERRNFDLNLFQQNFCEKFKTWKKNVG